MKLTVGDKVMIVAISSSIPEQSGGMGMVGKIVETYISQVGIISYRVESKSFTIRNSWWFAGHHLRLVAEPLAPVVNVSERCPRCSGELHKKETVDFGTIKKCRNCGWC